MENKANYIAVGAFVLLSAIGFVLFILWMEEIDYGNSRQTYDIYFKESVVGLRESEQVLYYGVPIGIVKKITIDTQQMESVLVTISVTDPRLIREDTHASLESKGITGQTYVQLLGGATESPILKAKKGEKNPIIHSLPSRLEKLFGAAPKALDRLIVLMNNLSDIFSDKNRKAIDHIIENTSKFSDMLAENLDTVPKISKAADDIALAANNVSIMVGENRKNIKTFTTTGLYQISRFFSEARKSVDNFSQFLNTLERTPSAFLFNDLNKGKTIDEVQ